ncbi:PspC domain-containing protein [Paenibacillus tuaregi]|uniref:PspC domain-containing protein n=1 Tax=Paenibacillus tuaregi TaxID=1816681 RepID=UPI000837FD97|nr:PspC domain-containing protein [Paenibacillus tuaregi]
MGTLYRSRRDRWITGLCGGLAESFGVNVGVLRLLTAISIPFSGGTTILIYLIASLVISKEPYVPYDPYQHGGWQGGGYGPGPGPGGYDPRDPRYNQRPPYGNNPFGGNSYNGNPFGGNPFQGGPTSGARPAGSSFRSQEEASNLDSMMEDIEKKAMKKELDELRRKLSKYEKGDL